MKQVSKHWLAMAAAASLAFSTMAFGQAIPVRPPAGTNSTAAAPVRNPNGTTNADPCAATFNGERSQLKALEAKQAADMQAARALRAKLGPNNPEVIAAHQRAVQEEQQIEAMKHSDVGQDQACEAQRKAAHEKQIESQPKRTHNPTATPKAPKVRPVQAISHVGHGGRF